MSPNSAYPEGRQNIPPFDGENLDLSQWKFLLRTEILSLEVDESELMEFVIMMEQIGDLDNEQVSAKTPLNRRLYILIARSTRGQALEEIKSIEIGNGLLALRALEDRFRPCRTMNKFQLLHQLS